MKMGLFKKKDKKKQETLEPINEDGQDFKNKTIKKSSYRIHLYEDLSGLPRKIKTFVADRMTDEDDNIPYLRYEDQKTKKVWLEIFPQKVEENIKYSEKELKEKIGELRKKIKVESEKEFSRVNLKDYKHKLMKLLAIERSFKFSQKTSYISLDENGVPEIFYERDGSNYIPFKWDTDKSTIYHPDDNLNKSATISLRNKEKKYPTAENRVRIATMIMFVLLFIGVIGNGVLSWKLVGMYDEAEITKLKEQNLQDTQTYNELFKQQAGTMQTILNNMSSNIIVTGGGTSRDDRPVNFDRENE